MDAAAAAVGWHAAMYDFVFALGKAEAADQAAFDAAVAARGAIEDLVAQMEADAP